MSENDSTMNRSSLDAELGAVRAEIKGLRELFEYKLDSVEKTQQVMRRAIEKLTESIITRSDFTKLERRVDKLETDSISAADCEVRRAEMVRTSSKIDDHEKRLERVERIIWIQAGFFTLFGVPTILWLIIQLLERLIS